jgi:hypothetical protein
MADSTIYQLFKPCLNQQNSKSHRVRHSQHPRAVEGQDPEGRLVGDVADGEEDVRPTRVQNLEQASVVGEK